MRKHIALGTVLALGIGTQAMAAEGFSYSNVEASFVNGKMDFDDGEGGEVNLDGDGFSLAASAAFNDTFFGFASLGDLDLDGAKLKPITAGVGFHWALNPNLDLVSGASFERLKISGIGGSVSESGYGISAGLRGRVGESVELSGGLKYMDVGNFGTDFAFNVGGRYYFTDAFAAGVDFVKYDDLKLDTWSISLRYDFGR